MDEEKQRSGSSLTDSQRARIERNRQRALLLRQSTVANYSYKNSDAKISRIDDNKLIDTNGGFFLEEQTNEPVEIKSRPAPVIGAKVKCEECEKEIVESYLLTNYDQQVCDDCKNEENYTLITKTDAKNSYLLKDCDLDKREPPLKFIRRKNPRNDRWGEMHLYLKCQVEKRALEVWGSEQNLEEEHERRNASKERSREKKFDAKVRELRKAVRSSTWVKKNTTHEHEYGAEVYSETDDVYIKTCKSCGHQVSYEKM